MIFSEQVDALKDKEICPQVHCSVSCLRHVPEHVLICVKPLEMRNKSMMRNNYEHQPMSHMYTRLPLSSTVNS